MTRVSQGSSSGVSTCMAAPLSDPMFVPAMQPVIHIQRQNFWEVQSPVLSYLAMLFMCLARGVASFSRWVSSWMVSRRVTLTSILRATYTGVAEMCMSMGRDGTWFLHYVLSVTAELTAAMTASIAGVLLFTAWTWNAAAHRFGAALEGVEPARIDRLDSLEFVHSLRAAHVSPCCVSPVSPEFLRSHVHANYTRRIPFGSSVFACIMVIWSLTTSLLSPLLVGRKLVSTELVHASLDIGGSPSPSLGVKLSNGGAHLLMVRLRTLILEYDKRVAFS